MSKKKIRNTGALAEAAAEADPAASPPRVLCISGHDPGGGAGVQADIEAVAAQGAHALTAITALTVQDTAQVYRVEPVATDLLAEQVARMLEDGPVAAIKVGLVGAAAQIEVILGAARRTGAPLVVDPVLWAGGGGRLAGDHIAQALLAQLLPRADVITPNAAEARALSGCSDLDEAAAALLERGCRSVLITGGDEPGDEVQNRWWHAQGQQRFRWPRLPETFHGAGCTLAAALAARLARGEPLALAVDSAQRYVQQALDRALRVGRGRRIPGRIAP